MVFSEWQYSRPDYAQLKNTLSIIKSSIISALSYDELRSSWLDMKNMIQHMEYMEMIAYIRHLCGINYEENTREVVVQNSEDPEIYAICAEIDRLVKSSCYADALRNEFGSMVFAHVNELPSVNVNDSVRLQREELQLKTRYRKLISARERDEDELYRVFDRLCETRKTLAESLGYNSYIDLGYHLRNRYDYGKDELKLFRERIRNSVTPVLNEYRNSGITRIRIPASADNSRGLVAAVADMFRDLGGGDYIEEMTRYELYDLDLRDNKRPDRFTCCMIPCKKLPFVIGGFSGDGMETGMAVHEFGHGFAFYTAARTQPLYDFHRSSPSINEIHSKTMEYFMFPYLDSFVGEKKKEFVINHTVREFENLIYRCAIDEFEHEMYELTHRTRIELCELWASISNKYMPWKTIDAGSIRKGNAWPHQTHIVEVPFYYIEYDLAQIGACEFYLKMQRDQKAAWQDYVRLCGAGGSRPYFELLKIARLSNPFSESIIKNISSVFADI
ncbi:MAG: hypothetical protein K6G56_02470 [Clostridiales bacterium]|nr:hypothetical protein [Clostridiales bacterium]